MDIYLHNTLTKNKNLFKTADGSKTVRLYSCGPTVYNYLHIGNLRAYVFADILKRALAYNGYEVRHVMNVTDIGHLTSDADDGDDKMVKALKREGKPMTLEGLKEVGEFYFQKAKEDFKKINILPADIYPFASDEIPAQIEMIEKLLEKKLAYITKEAIYFSVGDFKEYGRLGGSASDEHSRIGVNEEKKDSRDFALWKFSDNQNGIGFAAPFGRGFPGWHIECSAMSMKYLGEQFDIHTGGIDHITVHHNNEIAQSEAITGKILANYWLHNNHLTIGSDKMAKSGENFLTLKVLEEKGISPLAYRYWLLTAHYSTRMDYSEEAIKAAQTSFARLTATLSSFPSGGVVNSDYKNKFQNFINDDLDTPKALALVWEILKDTSISDADKKATILDFDKALGLDLENAKTEEIEVSEEIKDLLEKRKIAKESRDFALADQIRKEIENKGYSLKDQKDGTQNLTKN